MKIQEILQKVPPQFKLETVRDDYIELIPSTDIGEKMGDFSGKIDPRDKIVIEKFGTLRMSHFGAMRKFRKEYLNIPDGGPSMGIAGDEDKKNGFLTYLYRIDNKEISHRKIYFIKTGIAENYRYFARVEINKLMSNGSGITNSDLLTWSMFLNENIGIPTNKDA